MILCQEAGCTREARFAPKICVPAMGWPIDLHQPIEMVLGLKLCRDHCEGFRLKETLELEGGIRGVVEIMARGKVPPDFERAFVTPLRLDAPEFLMMERAKQSGEH